MRKSWKLVFTCFTLAMLEISTIFSAILKPSWASQATATETTKPRPPSTEATTSEQSQLENPSYKKLLPQTEVTDLNEKSEAPSGFDDEDRSFNEETKSKNLAAMTELAKAIPDYVDTPNSVRNLLSSASLTVRMKRTSEGWRPVRIDGEPYLRAIFSESWIYLSKQSDFRRALEKIDYSSVRFEVKLTVLSSLAFDEKPRSRIQGNFVALEITNKKSTAKEWQLLAAWQRAGAGAGLGINVIGLAQYAYDAYKNRNREDPILLRLQQSPAYKAPLKEKY